MFSLDKRKQISGLFCSLNGKLCFPDVFPIDVCYVPIFRTACYDSGKYLCHRPDVHGQVVAEGDAAPPAGHGVASPAPRAIHYRASATLPTLAAYFCRASES